MADDLIVTDEAIEDPLVLKRLLSDIIERLSNEVNEVLNSTQSALFFDKTKIQLQDEGIRVNSAINKLNFEGAGVIASSAGLITISEEKTFTRPGPLTTLAGISRWYPTKELTITGIRANVGEAPVGNDILIDIKKNDVTILTNDMIIPDGLFLNTPTDIAISPYIAVSVDMLVTDFITIDVLQIGRQPTVGRDLIVNFDYT